MPNSSIFAPPFGGGGPGGGGLSFDEGTIKELSGGSISTPAAGCAVLFKDTDNDKRLSIVDDAGDIILVTSLIPGGFVPTVADLNTTFPAADNTGSLAIVGATDVTDDDGVYYSTGVAWVKILNDSDFVVGLRENLWDYDPSAIGYLPTDVLANGQPGVLHNFDGDAIANPTDLTVQNAFDGSDGTEVQVTNSSANYLHTSDAIGRTFPGATKNVGKVTFTNELRIQGPGTSSFGMKRCKFQGLLVDGGEATDGNWADISVLDIDEIVVYATTTISHDGTIITFDDTASENGVDKLYTIDVFLSISGFFGFRVKIVETYGGNSNIVGIKRFQAFEVDGIPAPDVKMVNSINKNFYGYKKVRKITDADSPVTLTGEDGFIKGDASGGAITINLPPKVDFPNKVYIIKIANTSGSDITIVADGSDTIDGESSQTISPSAAREAITIIDDGDEWSII